MLSGLAAFLVEFKVLGLALGGYQLQGGADVRTPAPSSPVADVRA